MDYIFVSSLSFFLLVLFICLLLFFKKKKLWKLGLSITNTRTSDLYNKVLEITPYKI
jgi:hypothetical protein